MFIQNNNLYLILSFLKCRVILIIFYYKVSPYNYIYKQTTPISMGNAFCVRHDAKPDASEYLSNLCSKSYLTSGGSKIFGGGLLNLEDYGNSIYSYYKIL